MKLINRHRSQIVIAFLMLGIVILGFKFTELQNNSDKLENQKNQVQKLLTGENRVAGYTCGVLTETRAKELLKSEVVQDYMQGPADRIQTFTINDSKLFWSDNCRYEASDNSNKYVEFYLSTFISDEEAKYAFPKFLKTVNDNEKLESLNDGEELIYDAGVIYLLRNNKVIQVSASNGVPSESKQFVQELFDQIISDTSM